jgi:hypothetical protein
MDVAGRVSDAAAARKVFQLGVESNPRRPKARGQQTEADRRIQRLHQVRAQEAAFSSRLVRAYDTKKADLDQAAVAHATEKWQQDRAMREVQLQTKYATAVENIGQSHEAAQAEAGAREDLARQQYWTFIRCRAEDTRRYGEALHAWTAENTRQTKIHADRLQRRNDVLQIERERAREAATIGAAQRKMIETEKKTKLVEQEYKPTAVQHADYFDVCRSTYVHAAIIKSTPSKISAIEAARLISQNAVPQISEQIVYGSEKRGENALAKLQKEKVCYTNFSDILAMHAASLVTCL